ncbi:helix-turn-helix domain-containing protein [Hymenobacter metallicola]|uniref:Helix-turn-helix domain-containing protein n=1 Tax=Hymenobacter metallicola TaxID=2563114 RepID=A0A4Z0PT54_9BACT|nr:helix-turn-helix domain-containing protein [Hymenobacter metallicola]
MSKELIARTLLQLRNRRAITQEQLAARSGVGIPTIQRIEAAAATAQLSTLALLAKALEAPVQTLTDPAPQEPLPGPSSADARPGSARRELVLLHVLPLLGWVLPLANVAAPLLYWLYKREQHECLDAQGRLVLPGVRRARYDPGRRLAAELLYGRPGGPARQGVAPAHIPADAFAPDSCRQLPGLGARA